MATNIWQNLKGKILAGLLAIAPVALTFYILRALFNFLDKLTGPILKQFNFSIPGFGLILTLVLIYLLGLFVTNVLGRRLFSWGEKVLISIPLVNTIYKTIKQITQAFSGVGNRTFQSVVYIEYPRKNLWTLAFVTGESVNHEGTEFFHIFLPTTPNPTSGFFIMVPKQDTFLANINVEEGLKAIISGGMLAPVSHSVSSPEQKKME